MAKSHCQLINVFSRILQKIFLTGHKSQGIFFFYLIINLIKKTIRVMNVMGIPIADHFARL